MTPGPLFIAGDDPHARTNLLSLPRRTYLAVAYRDGVLTAEQAQALRSKPTSSVNRVMCGRSAAA
jgi:hypothetical protein